MLACIVPGLMRFPKVGHQLRAADKNYCYNNNYYYYCYDYN